MAKKPGPGPLPAAYGKISTFGGIDDKEGAERKANLSYTDFYPFEKLNGSGSYAVLAYLNATQKNKPMWFRAMFAKAKRADAIASLNPEYGLFAYLEEGALFCAGRWDNTNYKKLLDDENPWVTFTNPKTRKTITCLRIDWGPNENTGRAYDLSPMAADYIGAKNDDFVVARYATSKEIEAAKRYMKNLWEAGLEGTTAYKKYLEDLGKKKAKPSKVALPSTGGEGFNPLWIILALGVGSLLISKGRK